MDLKSVLGYSRNSPYRGNPYLDINSPNGLIDMSQTDIDLTGIDNFGNKKKMKAGRKKPYKFAGTTIREIPMQQGGVYTSQAQIDVANRQARDLLTRQNADQFLVSNSYVARNIGDPVIQYNYPQGRPQNTAKLATSLPFGVTAQDVMNTQQGYGYIHPQNGNFVPVDANAVFAASNKQATPAPAYAKAYKQGGTNPYMQKGGYSPMDLYRYLFSNDDESDYNDDKEQSPHTAPSEEELGLEVEQQPQEPDDYEMALQMALAQDNYDTVQGDGGTGSLNTEYFTPKVTVGVNPYKSSPAQNVGNPSKYAYDFFQQKGLPAHVAAGIVGNLIQESGNFRPDVITDEITGDNGASHGIAQWQGARWPALKQWAASQGKDPHSLDAQLEYVYQEANQRGDLQKTLQASTPEEAARIFAKHYERPAYIDNNRSRNARQLYQQK